MQGIYSRVGWDPRDNESEFVDMAYYKECIEVTDVRERLINDQKHRIWVWN
jgi:hypothetical protein